MSADKSDTPRTDALLSGIDSFGRIPTMEDRFQRMCRHARHLEREVTAMTAANADLTAQLAAARRDAERLDWIDTLSSSGLDHIGYGDYRYYVHGKGYPLVREVIDAAMKEPK